MNKNKTLIIYVIIIIILISLVLLTYKNLSDKEKHEQLIQELKVLFEKESEKVEIGLIDFQKTVDEEIKTVLKNKNINLENAKVLINPYRISPLSALIIFNTQSKVSVDIKINGGEKISFAKGTEHVIPVYGLRANYDNQVLITTNDNVTKTFSIKTAQLPTSIATMSITENKKVQLNEELYLLTSPTDVSSVAYDKEGNVRWYLTEKLFATSLILSNGHLLLSNGKNADSNMEIVEIDLLGKIHNEYVLKEGNNHNIIAKDNNYILVTNHPTEKRNQDYLVEMDKTGNIVKFWDLYEIIKKVDSEFVKTLENYWAVNTTLFYDSKTNSLLLSIESLNSIISIDYGTNKINWIFGDIDDWSEKFASYFLTVDANSRLPLTPYSPVMTSDGLLGFYNSGYEVEDINSDLCSTFKQSYSAIELYKIDNRRISQVMEYNVNTSALSAVKVLNNGNKLILNGWELTGDECVPLGSLNFLARILELDANNNTIFETTIPQGKFGITKLALYTNNTKKISLASYKKYDNTHNNTIKTTKLKNHVDKIKNAEKINVSYKVDTNSLKFQGVIPAEIEAKILFVGENGNGYEYTVKEKNSDVLKSVYTKNLKGKYRIFFIWNGVYKDTEIILVY